MNRHTLRMVLVAIFTAITSSIRRLIRGPLLPSWNFSLEIAVQVMKRMIPALARLDPETLSEMSSSGGGPASEFVKRAESEVVSVPISGEWIRPPGGSGSDSLLFLHGGGYVMGSVDSHRDLASRLAIGANTNVFAINYRLAPAHPYPAAIEDAQTAYEWLLESGHDASRIIVAGDSAGGGLTAALLQKLRDDGRPLPRAAILISPWLDLTCSSPSHQRNAASDYLPTGALKQWAGYYAQDEPLDQPLVSPHFCDCTGLPPLQILVGTAEVLCDEGMEYARKAEKAGVEVSLHEGHEMPHDWPILAGVTPLAVDAIDEMTTFIRTQLGRQ